MKQLNPGLHRRGKLRFPRVAVCLTLLLLLLSVKGVKAQVTNIVLNPNATSYCQGDSITITFTISGISLVPTTTIDIANASNNTLTTLYSGTTLLNLGGGQFSIKVGIPSTPSSIFGGNRHFKISYTGIGSGTGNSSSFTLSSPSVGGTVASAQTICSGTSPANLTLTGNTGTVVKWQKATNAAFTSPTDIAITATTLTSANIGTLTTNTYFRAVVQNGSCPVANSSSVLITIRPNPAGTLSTVTTPICAGTQAQLRFTSSAGTGPFSLIINGTTYNSITSGTPFNVTPNITTTTIFNLTKITDANGCILQNP